MYNLRWHFMTPAVVIVSAIATIDAAAGSPLLSVCQITDAPSKYDGVTVLVRAEVRSDGRTYHFISDPHCPKKCINLSTIPGPMPKGRLEYRDRNEIVRDAVLYDRSEMLGYATRIIATFSGTYHWKNKVGDIHKNILEWGTLSDINLIETIREGPFPGDPQSLFETECYRESRRAR